MFAQRLSIGIGVGGYGPGYYAPPAYSQYVPPCPGPGYTWADGYWGPQGVWVGGFWRAPYAGSYRVAPRFVEPRYYNSYRGFDRDRGFDNRYRNWGGERHDERHDDRGHGYSNGFRR